jgi:hypothetical protein
LGRREHNKKENADFLAVANIEIGLEVCVDKTECMVMSRGQNAGRSHNMKIDNIFLEKVEEFKYLETTLTNQILFRKKLRIY